MDGWMVRPISRGCWAELKGWLTSQRLSLGHDLLLFTLDLWLIPSPQINCSTRTTYWLGKPERQICQSFAPCVIPDPTRVEWTGLKWMGVWTRIWINFTFTKGYQFDCKSRSNALSSLTSYSIQLCNQIALGPEGRRRLEFNEIVGALTDTGPV